LMAFLDRKQFLILQLFVLSYVYLVHKKRATFLGPPFLILLKSKDYIKFVTLTLL
jgi:hypothetical protein